jgi:pilus assembly protein Flp/PilA
MIGRRGGFQMRFLQRFKSDVSGSIGIEYAVIGTIISTAIIVGALAIGTSLGETFTNLSVSFG